MKLFTKPLLGALALLATAAVAAEITDAEVPAPNTAVDSVSTPNATVANALQCAAPYEKDYMDLLEEGSTELLFSGCGGLL